MGTKYFIAVGVFSVELFRAYQVSMLCACKLATIARFIYKKQYWVECISSVISFAHFTDFSNFNIS